MKDIETLKERLLLKIDRHVKIAHLSKRPINEEAIDRLTDKFIELFKKELS